EKINQETPDAKLIEDVSDVVKTEAAGSGPHSKEFAALNAKITDFGKNAEVARKKGDEAKAAAKKKKEDAKDDAERKAADEAVVAAEKSAEEEIDAVARSVIVPAADLFDKIGGSHEHHEHGAKVEVPQWYKDKAKSILRIKCSATLKKTSG